MANLSGVGRAKPDGPDGPGGPGGCGRHVHPRLELVASASKTDGGRTRSPTPRNTQLAKQKEPAETNEKKNPVQLGKDRLH